MHIEDLIPASRALSRSFNEVFEDHGYSPPFGSEQSAQQLAQWYLKAEPKDCFVAEVRGHVAGLAFLHRRGERASIGPVAVDPRYQRLHLGRMLMERLLERAEGCQSVRLFQDAFNPDSFALYSKLGFRAVELVPIVLAKPGIGSKWSIEPSKTKNETGEQESERTVRPRSDIEVMRIDSKQADRAIALDRKINGATREVDLRYLIDVGLALLLQQEGVDCGYLCAYTNRGGTYIGPALASSQQQLQELLKAVSGYYPQQGLIFRLPARNDNLLQQVLMRGFRVSSLGTLMVRGEYQQSAGAEMLAVFPESL